MPELRADVLWEPESAPVLVPEEAIAVPELGAGAESGAGVGTESGAESRQRASGNLSQNGDGKKK